MTVGEGADRLVTRDLARNGEFSKIAVIRHFFTVLKNKTQLSVGGGILRERFRDKSCKSTVSHTFIDM